jgi:crotonobetainyl-CoA:carnitine CoA-transferase CaiB-like acyl-CoA transferase
MKERLVRLSKSTTLSALQKFGVPSGAINSVKEALNDKQAQHRKIVHDIEGVPAIRTPIIFDSLSLKYNHAAPKLGQHTAEIKSKISNSEFWKNEN